VTDSLLDLLRPSTQFPTQYINFLHFSLVPHSFQLAVSQLSFHFADTQ
jgi:hypothetical protein